MVKLIRRYLDLIKKKYTLNLKLSLEQSYHLLETFGYEKKIKFIDIRFDEKLDKVYGPLPILFIFENNIDITVGPFYKIKVENNININIPGYVDDVTTLNKFIEEEFSNTIPESLKSLISLIIDNSNISYELIDSSYFLKEFEPLSRRLNTVKYNCRLSIKNYNLKDKKPKVLYLNEKNEYEINLIRNFLLSLNYNEICTHSLLDLSKLPKFTSSKLSIFIEDDNNIVGFLNKNYLRNLIYLSYIYDYDNYYNKIDKVFEISSVYSVSNLIDTKNLFISYLKNDILSYRLDIFIFQILNVKYRIIYKTVNKGVESIVYIISENNKIEIGKRYTWKNRINLEFYLSIIDNNCEKYNSYFIYDKTINIIGTEDDTKETLYVNNKHIVFIEKTCEYKSNITFRIVEEKSE